MEGKVGVPIYQFSAMIHSHDKTNIEEQDCQECKAVSLFGGRSSASFKQGIELYYSCYSYID